MKIRSLALCATALLLPFGAAACGEESTGDLSKDDVKAELIEGGLAEPTADCMADVMIDADFTESELNAISSGELTSGEKYDAFFSATMDCAMADAGASAGG